MTECRAVGGALRRPARPYPIAGRTLETDHRTRPSTWTVPSGARRRLRHAETPLCREPACAPQRRMAKLWCLSRSLVRGDTGSGRPNSVGCNKTGVGADLTPSVLDDPGDCDVLGSCLVSKSVALIRIVRPWKTWVACKFKITANRPWHCSTARNIVMISLYLVFLHGPEAVTGRGSFRIDSRTSSRTITIEPP